LEALAAVAVLTQAQRGFHGVLVEGVDHPLSARQIELAVFDFRLEFRIGNPLERDEDLHEFLLSRPRRTRAPTQSAARTISNFSLPPKSQARASSSIIPKMARAAIGAGMAASNWPLSCPSATIAPRSLRSSANCGRPGSFMNFELWRSSTVSTSASGGFSRTSDR